MHPEIGSSGGRSYEQGLNKARDQRTMRNRKMMVVNEFLTLEIKFRHGEILGYEQRNAAR